MDLQAIVYLKLNLKSWYKKIFGPLFFSSSSFAVSLPVLLAGIGDMEVWPFAEETGRRQITCHHSAAAIPGRPWRASDQIGQCSRFRHNPECRHYCAYSRLILELGYIVVASLGYFDSEHPVLCYCSVCPCTGWDHWAIPSLSGAAAGCCWTAQAYQQMVARDSWREPSAHSQPTPSDYPQWAAVSLS